MRKHDLLDSTTVWGYGTMESNSRRDFFKLRYTLKLDTDP